MLRKSLIALSLCGLFAGANAEQASGVFAGVNAGVPITTPDYSGSLSNIKSILPTSGIGYNLGVSLGFRQALNESMGLRYYVEYDFNQSFGSGSGNMNGAMKVDTKASINQHLITLNVDYYYNFTSAFGAFIGVGVGYQSYKPSWTATIGGNDTKIGSGAQGGLAVPVNVGVSYNINPQHQITLGAKIPLVAYEYKTTLPAQIATMMGGGSNNKPNKQEPH